MSLESAQEFIDRANQDQVIRKLARERFGDIVEVGREHGYDFELDEFDLAMRERKAQTSGPGGSQCSVGDEVCQCGPTGGTASVCQCPTGTQRPDRGATCQCGPSGGTGTHRRDEGATCQCVPPPTGSAKP